MVHATLENAGADGDLVEHYMVTPFFGGLVSGTVDLFTARGDLYDWKYTSVWSVAGEPKPEWVLQVNIYAAMLRRQGYSPKSLNILAIFRDWSRTKAQHTRGYPACGAQVVSIPMWEDLDVVTYIEDRLSEHHRLLNVADNDLPDCTPEERWVQPPKYAVMKRGRKSALRLLDSQDEALAYIAKSKKLAGDSSVYIDFRPGKSTRCGDYCPVAEFCNTRHV